MYFGRLLTAMITPFHADESVNFEAVEHLANHLADTGTDGIVVTGTTGESPTLTTEEKLDLYRAVKRAVGDRAAVIAGTGNYCTRESIELTRAAEGLGVDGAMLVVPYYNNPPQEGLYRHFRAVAESTRLPVILYNVPSRSPRNLDPDTVVRLTEVPNIVAVKEASGKLEQMAEIVARTPAAFQLYSGDDAVTLPVLAIGGVGVVSVASHAAGRLIKQMIEAFLAGRTEEAAALNGRLLPFFRACFCEPNPIPIKAAMNLMGIPAGGVRLPLVSANEKVIAAIRKAMEDLSLLEAAPDRAPRSPRPAVRDP